MVVAKAAGMLRRWSLLCREQDRSRLEQVIGKLESKVTEPPRLMDGTPDTTSLMATSWGPPSTDLEEVSWKIGARRSEMNESLSSIHVSVNLVSDGRRAKVR